MRLLFRLFLFRLFLSLCVASANVCAAPREFAVDNCTACPTFDHTRGNVQMAVCEERGVDAGGTMIYACVCGNFPASSFLVHGLLYYPQIEGNVTRCAASWATAPVLYTCLSVVGAGVILYAVSHLFYIVLLSTTCCGNSTGCKKVNVSAFFFIVAGLFWTCIPLWRIITQGEIAIGAGSNMWLAHGFDNMLLGGVISQTIGMVLLLSSLFDVAYNGDKRICCRSVLNTVFGCGMGTYALSYIFVAIVRVVRPDLSGIYALAAAMTLLNFVFSLFAGPIIHVAMCKVSQSCVMQCMPGALVPFCA